jgi:hypothetical protein
LFFYYEAEFPRPAEPALITEFIDNRDGPEIIIWTNFGTEEGPFLTNGEEAITDFGPP